MPTQKSRTGVTYHIYAYIDLHTPMLRHMQDLQHLFPYFLGIALGPDTLTRWISPKHTLRSVLPLTKHPAPLGEQTWQPCVR